MCALTLRQKPNQLALALAQISRDIERTSWPGPRRCEACEAVSSTGDRSLSLNDRKRTRAPARTRCTPSSVFRASSEPSVPSRGAWIGVEAAVRRDGEDEAKGNDWTAYAGRSGRKDDEVDIP